MRGKFVMMRIVAVFRALRQAETAGLANSTRRPPKSGSARRNQEIPRHPGHLGFKIRQRLNVSRAKSYFSTLTPSARSALFAMLARVKKFVMSFLKIAGSWLVLLVLLGGIFVWISSDYENPRELLPEDLFS